jgi:hypothetical protein
LHQVPPAYQTQVNDLLLTALLNIFVQWQGDPLFLFDLEGHGREDLFEEVDLSRTVGWFTTVFPVLLHRDNGSDLGVKLMSVEVRDRLRRLPQPEIAFNYMGQFDFTLSQFDLFRLGPEFAGELRSPQDLRLYLIELNGWIKP